MKNWREMTLGEVESILLTSASVPDCDAALIVLREYLQRYSDNLLTFAVQKVAAQVNAPKPVSRRLKKVYEENVPCVLVGDWGEGIENQKVS